MKKPQEHITDARGDAIFREVFADWGVNASQQDYGWDYVVEVFREKVSTGLIFNAQLKSSTVTPYSVEGTFICVWQEYLAHFGGLIWPTPKLLILW